MIASGVLHHEFLCALRAHEILYVIGQLIEAVDSNLKGRKMRVYQIPLVN